jgi:hypothetical protein
MADTYESIEKQKYMYIDAHFKHTEISNSILAYCHVTRPLLQALLNIITRKVTPQNIHNFANNISKHHHDAFNLQERRQHDPHETLQVLMRGVNAEHANTTAFEPTLPWAIQCTQTRITLCNNTQCRYTNHTPQTETTLWGPPNPQTELAYHLNDPDKQFWTGPVRPEHTHKGSKQLLINKTANILIITYKKKRIHPVTLEESYTTGRPNAPLRMQIRQRESDSIKIYALRQTISHIHGEHLRHYITYMRDPITNNIYKINDTRVTLLKKQNTGKPHPEFLNKFTVILVYTAEMQDPPPTPTNQHRPEYEMDWDQDFEHGNPHEEHDLHVPSNDHDTRTRPQHKPTTHNQQSFRNNNLLCHTETMLQMLAHTWSEIHPHLHNLAKRYPNNQNGIATLLEALSTMHSPRPNFPKIKGKMAKWLNQQTMSKWRLQQHTTPTIEEKIHGIGDIWSGLSDDIKDPSIKNKLLPLPGKIKVLGIGPKHKLHLQGIKYCTNNKLNTNAIEPSTRAPLLIPFVFGNEQKKISLPLTFKYQTNTYRLIARSQKLDTSPPHLTCMLANLENSKVWTYDSGKNSGRIALATETQIHGRKKATTSAIYARKTQETPAIPNQTPAKRKLTFPEKTNQTTKTRKPKPTPTKDPKHKKQTEKKRTAPNHKTQSHKNQHPQANWTKQIKTYKPPTLNLQHKQIARILKNKKPHLKRILIAALQDIRRIPCYPQDKHISIDFNFMNTLTKAFNINTQVGTHIVGFHPTIKYVDPMSDVPIPQIPPNHPMAAVILAGISRITDPNVDTSTRLIKQAKHNLKPLRILVLTHKEHIPTAIKVLTIKAQGLPMTFLNTKNNTWENLRHMTNLHIHLIENTKGRRKWKPPTPAHQNTLLTWAKQHNTHIAFHHYWPSPVRQTRTTPRKEITVTSILRQLRKQMKHLEHNPNKSNKPPKCLTKALAHHTQIFPRQPNPPQTNTKIRTTWEKANEIATEGINPSHTSRLHPPNFRHLGRDAFRSNMTDWHATIQTTFPIQNTEIPTQGIYTDKRTDARLNGWRYEIESQIPTKAKVKQRQQLMGKNIRWIIDMRNYKDKIHPYNHENQHTNIQFRHKLKRPGLLQIKHRQYWDIGCTDGLLKVHSLHPHSSNQTSETGLLTWKEFMKDIQIPKGKQSTHFQAPYFQENRYLSLQQWLHGEHTPLSLPSPTESATTQNPPQPENHTPIPTTKLTKTNVGQWIQPSIKIPDNKKTQYNRALKGFLDSNEGGLDAEVWTKALVEAAKSTRPEQTRKKHTKPKPSKSPRKIHSLQQKIRTLRNLHRQLRFHHPTAPTQLIKQIEKATKTQPHDSLAHKQTTLLKNINQLQNNITSTQAKTALKAYNRKQEEANSLFQKNRKQAWRVLMENSRDLPPKPSLEAQAAYFQQRFGATLYTAIEGRQALDRLLQRNQDTIHTAPTWTAATARRRTPNKTFPESQLDSLQHAHSSAPNETPTAGVGRPPNNFRTLQTCVQVTKGKLQHPKTPPNLPIPPPNTLKNLLYEKIQQNTHESIGDGIAIRLSKADLRNTRILPLINIARRNFKKGSMVFTDGSRDPSDSHSGRATLIARANGSAIAHLGTSRPGSSGLQEVLAARDALHITREENLPTPAHIITDYLSLANTKWAEQSIKLWKNSEIPGAWQHTEDMLKIIPTHFYHVRAHQTKNKSPIHHLNDQVDGAAKLALQICREDDGTIPLSQEPLHRPIPPLTKPQAMERLLRPITLAELNVTIQALKNDGASDSQGLSPNCIKKLNTQNRKHFLHVLENIRQSGNIPATWKMHKLILLWKQKHPAEDTKNWRPITVQHTCLNVFTRILAQRLLELLWHLEIIPMSQKCNIAGVAGVQQHVATLAALLCDAWCKAKMGQPCKLTIILTDIAKAFDSVQRGVIIAVLEHLLGPEAQTFIDTIKNLYTNVWIILSDENTQYRQEKLAALNQGDALSPIIFILILMLVRDAVNRQDRHTEYTLQFQPNTPLGELTYADDVADIIASMDTNKINEFQECLRLLHMTINPEKTLALTLSTRNKKIIALDKEILIDGTPVQTLTLHSPWKYLGTYFTGGMNHWAITRPATQQYVDNMAQIQLTPLYAQAKLNFAETARQKLVATFCHPAWDKHAIALLETHERVAIANVLSTPKLPIAFCAAPLEMGGLGLTLFRDLHRELILCTLVGMLWSHDTRVQNAALNMINSTQTQLNIPQGRKAPPFFRWDHIPRRAHASPRKHPWPVVEYATAAHMLHISLEIDNRGVLTVKLNDPHIGAEIEIRNLHKLRLWIAKARRKKYRKWIKGAYNMKQIEAEEVQIRTGNFEGPTTAKRKYQHTNSRIAYLPKNIAKTARAFLRPNSTRKHIGDILQCQLGLLHTNLQQSTYTKGSTTNKCRWCDQIETVGHVLAPKGPEGPNNPHPKSTCSQVMQRHEEATKAIATILSSNKDIIIYNPSANNDTELRPFKTMNKITQKSRSRQIPPPPVHMIQTPPKNQHNKITYKRPSPDKPHQAIWPPSTTPQKQPKQPHTRQKLTKGGFRTTWSPTELPKECKTPQNNRGTIIIPDWHLVVPNYKPDILLIHTKKKSAHIIDLSFCDDGHVLTLQEQPWKHIIENIDIWDHKGIRIKTQLNRTKVLDRNDPRRKVAEALPYCPAARYLHRYNRLLIVLQRTNPDYEISISPIIAGVTGTAVLNSVSELTTKLELHKQITHRIMAALANASVRAIPKILKGWRLQRSLQTQT